MRSTRQLATLAAAILLIAALAAAQQGSPEKSAVEKQAAVATEKSAVSNPGQASTEPEGNKSEDENEQFKHSVSVQYIAKKLHITIDQAYWLCVVINFVIIAGLVGFGLKKGLPKIFRDRTAAIQKGMEEARRSSEDANRRLREIEEKLGRLDADIAQLQAAATTQAEEEAGRLKSAAEQEQRRIVQTAEQEIAAAVNTARRDLKAYSAELAIALAEKKIKVDPATDQELVRDFAAQLGRNGNR